MVVTAEAEKAIRQATETAVNRALAAFGDARSQARRFHGEALGKDVDPSHCFADFLMRVQANDDRGLEKTYGSVRTKAAMAESTGTTGGYLVPASLRLDLMADVAEEAIVRSRALVVPMTTAVLTLPLPSATVAQSAGTSPFFGGIVMTWQAEASTRTETEPAFRQATLTAHEMVGYAKVSNVLAADGGNGLEAVLRKIFARSIAWYEDYAFLRGNGAGKPLGMINSAAATTVTRASANDFKFADAVAMLGKLLPGSWERSVWVIHPLAWVKAVSLATSTTNVFQSAIPGAPGDAVSWLYGIPVFISEKVPTLGTLGDVSLLDCGLYVIGDRQAMEIAASDQEPTAFLANQSIWRVTHRIDGQPWLGGTVTLQDASTVCASFVVLQ